MALKCVETSEVSPHLEAPRLEKVDLIDIGLEWKLVDLKLFLNSKSHHFSGLHWLKLMRDKPLGFP